MRQQSLKAHPATPHHTRPYGRNFPRKDGETTCIEIHRFMLCYVAHVDGVWSDCYQVAPQQTVTVSSGFQSQASPVPTIPPYLCGAWSSNNAPGPNSTIVIFARITKNLAGVNGATASAVVHFQSGDQTA